MVKLGKRLKTIFDMVPPSIACDVGADHGKLIISLVENGIVSFGYAVENKKGPYEILKSAILEAGLENHIEAIYSDGIKDLSSDVSTLIIAGMGGDLIVNILKKDMIKLMNVNTIIVDPHTNIPLVREEISKIGFSIADEKMVEEDGKIYEIIKFTRSGTAYLNDLDKEYGPVLRKEKSMLFEKKYQERKNTLIKLSENKALSAERIDALKKEIERINQVL